VTPFGFTIATMKVFEAFQKVEIKKQRSGRATRTAAGRERRLVSSTWLRDRVYKFCSN
jgi:hypothetical protein